jgi:hypothetical protein
VKDTVIGLTGIPVAARAAREEDLSTATAPLPLGMFTSSSHTNEKRLLIVTSSPSYSSMMSLVPICRLPVSESPADENIVYQE